MGTDISLVSNLQERLSGRLGKGQALIVAYDAMADVRLLEALFYFIYNSDERLRWRAAWSLEMVSKRMPSLLVDERCRMRALAMRPDVTDGLRRLLFSILFNLPDEDWNVEFLNFVLDKMVDLKSPPGVQALAMKLAARMSRMHEELYEEFCSIVQNMELEFYSAGVRSAVKQCLKAKRKNR